MVSGGLEGREDILIGLKVTITRNTVYFHVYIKNILSNNFYSLAIFLRINST